MSTPKRCARTAILVGLLAVGWATTALAQVRKVAPGDTLMPFTLVQLEGGEFSYRPPRERVMILVFLAAHHKRSERAVEDLSALAARLRREGQPVDLLVVAGGGQGSRYFAAQREKWAVDVTILLDSNDVLWGQLGVVVTPTTLLVDAKGTIRWIRAGHSYDFAAETRTNLDQVLGLAPPPAGDAASPEPLRADDIAARVSRHLRLAQMLARRGKLDAGIAELRKADDVIPGVVAIRLELADLLVRAARPDDALATLESVRPATPAEDARLKTISGSARRELGDLEAALTLLTDAEALDPASGRTLYELGRVLEQRGECERAVATYRRALALHYGGGPGER